jgi:alpha-galactosidase
VRALYALIDRLRAAHPTVEIEACASGGGRCDWGMLTRAERVWVSDSNDALDRIDIQRNANLFLPPEMCGVHVGPARGDAPRA